MTIGRHGPQSAKPRPRAASQPISPVAASRPNTEPPDRTTPSTLEISPPARSASVLIVPGAPPRTSAAASAGRLGQHDGDAGPGAVVLGIADQQAGDVGQAVARARGGSPADTQQLAASPAPSPWPRPPGRRSPTNSSGWWARSRMPGP